MARRQPGLRGPVGLVRAHSRRRRRTMHAREGGGDGPVDKSYVDDGAWSIEIGREFYPCTVSLRPLYDPTGIRPKA